MADVDLCETGCGAKRADERMVCDEHQKSFEVFNSQRGQRGVNQSNMEMSQAWLDELRALYMIEHQVVWMSWT